MTLVQRLAAVLADEPTSEAEIRHLAAIRSQIEKIEGKLVRCSGWRDFRTAPSRQEAEGTR